MLTQNHIRKAVSPHSEVRSSSYPSGLARHTHLARAHQSSEIPYMWQIKASSKSDLRYMWQIHTTFEGINL